MSTRITNGITSTSLFFSLNLSIMSSRKDTKPCPPQPPNIILLPPQCSQASGFLGSTNHFVFAFSFDYRTETRCKSSQHLQSRTRASPSSWQQTQRLQCSSVNPLSALPFRLTFYKATAFAIWSSSKSENPGVFPPINSPALIISDINGVFWIFEPLLRGGSEGHRRCVPACVKE